MTSLLPGDKTANATLGVRHYSYTTMTQYYQVLQYMRCGCRR